MLAPLYIGIGWRWARRLNFESQAEREIDATIEAGKFAA